MTQPMTAEQTSGCLTAEEFDAFYQEIHGYTPFPWQSRLVKKLAENGLSSVEACDLPTGSGKTTLVEISVFLLAMHLTRGTEHRFPRRIFFVVDRRIVVSATARHAEKIAACLTGALEASGGPTILKRVAEALAGSSADRRPLAVAEMRGGMTLENSWVRHAAQPLVCVSTVDQVGSRLLFRGYGVSSAMRPVHAAMVAMDSLIIIDEAHLSTAFLQTLDGVRALQQDAASRDVSEPIAFATSQDAAARRVAETIDFSEPKANARSADTRLRRGLDLVAEAIPVPGLHVLKLSATLSPGDESKLFTLDAEDDACPFLKQRLSTIKKACLTEVKDNNKFVAQVVNDVGAILAQGALAGQTPGNPKKNAKETFKVTAKNREGAPVVGIVVNTIKRARAIHDALTKKYQKTKGEKIGVHLLIGRSRPLDREKLAPVLDGIASSRKANPEHPQIVVATQCIEAGADIDFDFLVTELAPLDALRQRFGRLDRIGWHGTTTARILYAKNEADQYNEKTKPGVYGAPMWETKKWLDGAQKEGIIDFGPNNLELPAPETLAKLISRTPEAPVLLPPHLDLLSATNPQPSVSPDVSAFLHGRGRSSADVTLVWRADVGSARAALGNTASKEDHDKALRIERDRLKICPPSSLEAMSTSVAAVRAWMSPKDTSTKTAKKLKAEGADSDLEGLTFMEKEPKKANGFDEVFSGAMRLPHGNSDEAVFLTSIWEIRPGDVLVIPTKAGGCDIWGWNPDCTEPVPDLSLEAARQARGLTIFRLWNGLAPNGVLSAVNEILANDDLTSCQARDAVIDTVSGTAALWPDGSERPDFEVLEAVNSRRALRRKVNLVLIKPRKEGAQACDGGVAMIIRNRTLILTEDPAITVEIDLPSHLKGVENTASDHAAILGDVKEAKLISLAGRLHDIGKAESREQIVYHGGNPIRAAAAAVPLAKSGGTPLDRNKIRQIKAAAGLPKGARHEMWSAAMAKGFLDSLATLTPADKDLVLWLIGAHHGMAHPLPPALREPHGSPFTTETITFMMDDGTQYQGPVMHSYDRLDGGWPELRARMQARYGWWGLAYLETLLRQADWAQSQAEQADADAPADKAEAHR